jgi:phage-related minor tail protein
MHQRQQDIKLRLSSMMNPGMYTELIGVKKTRIVMGFGRVAQAVSVKELRDQQLKVLNITVMKPRMREDQINVIMTGNVMVLERVATTCV